MPIESEVIYKFDVDGVNIGEATTHEQRIALMKKMVGIKRFKNPEYSLEDFIWANYKPDSGYSLSEEQLTSIWNGQPAYTVEELTIQLPVAIYEQIVS